MYLIIGKNNDKIIGITKVLDCQENGNVLCGDYAIAAMLVDRIEEVENVPDGIVPDYFAYKDGEYIQNEPTLKTTNKVTEADYVAALEELGVTFDE